MSSARRKISWLFAGFALAGTLFFLARSGRQTAAPRWDQRLAIAIVGPVSEGTASVSRRVSAFVHHWTELRGAQRENLALRAESERLEAEVLKLREENQQLRSRDRLFAESGVETSQGKVARVLGQDPSPLRRSLTIDAGREDGIEPDQIVIAKGGIVGRVLQAGPRRSQVLLITDLDSAVDVVAARTRARGILVGLRRDMGLKRERWLTQAEYVSGSEEILAGDLLLSSGQDGVFPQGYPVGVVEKVEKDASGLFWKAEVQPYAELQKLEEVLVLTANTIPPFEKGGPGGI
ncbi:MAG TPA: rod shape-determining protein MreC [bacterium]|nr:rod shape-determining protein MreC [bacterium]